MERRVEYIRTRLDRRQEQLALLISRRDQSNRIRDVLIDFKTDFMDYESDLQGRKEAGDPQVRAEVQTWSTFRNRYVRAINDAASYLDKDLPEGSGLRVSHVTARSFKFGEPRRSRSGSRGAKKGRSVTDAAPAGSELGALDNYPAVQQSAVTTSLDVLGQSEAPLAVVAQLGQTDADEGSVAKTSFEEDPRQPGGADDPEDEPFERRSSSRKSSAVSVPSQHTATPPPVEKMKRVPTGTEEPWRDTRIFGTSMSGVSSKTVEWTLQEFPDGEANIIAYLEDRADKLEELTNRLRQKPTDRAVRRLRDATEAARAILGKADKIRRQNRPGYRLVDPMAELLAAIEDAETVLMPYITAKGGVIQDAVIEAAARSKEDLPNNGKPRQPLLVDLASTNSRHEGTGESRGLNRPGDTGKGGRPATHEPGREMNESQSTAIALGKGVRGGGKGKLLPSIDQRPAKSGQNKRSDMAGTGQEDAPGFFKPKSPILPPRRRAAARATRNEDPSDPASSSSSSEEPRPAKSHRQFPSDKQGDLRRTQKRLELEARARKEKLADLEKEREIRRETRRLAEDELRFKRKLLRLGQRSSKQGSSSSSERSAGDIPQGEVPNPVQTPGIPSGQPILVQNGTMYYPMPTTGPSMFHLPSTGGPMDTWFLADQALRAVPNFSGRGQDYPNWIRLAKKYAELTGVSEETKLAELNVFLVWIPRPSTASSAS